MIPKEQEIIPSIPSSTLPSTAEFVQLPAGTSTHNKICSSCFREVLNSSKTTKNSFKKVKDMLYLVKFNSKHTLYKENEYIPICGECIQKFSDNDIVDVENITSYRKRFKHEINSRNTRI